jgi:hypothetical protein
MPDVKSCARPPHGRPVESKRPHGAHLFEVFSPKAERRLALFGVAALRCWLKIEADPLVTTLCERPLMLPEKKRHRAVDFWTSGSLASKYLMIIDAATAASVADGEQLYPAFQAWAREVECEVQYISSASLAEEASLWYTNWTDALQHLSRYQNYLPDDVLPRIERMCTGRRTIASFFENGSQENREMVRAAVFQLVHAGKLRFVDVTNHPLSDQSEVEPR